jgi:hypothetical protein
MTVMRRLVLLVALMFWQGGFMFYGAVVVPVGGEVLGSHLEQGFITRSVTNYLNMAGVVALALWCWDVAAGYGPGHRLRWGGLCLLALMLGVQLWLHLWLDELLDESSFRILDQPVYQRLHQCYLIISTAQCGLAVVLVALTIRAWRAEDATAAPHQAAGTTESSISE